MNLVLLGWRVSLLAASQNATCLSSMLVISYFMSLCLVKICVSSSKRIKARWLANSQNELCFRNLGTWSVILKTSYFWSAVFSFKVRKMPIVKSLFSKAWKFWSTSSRTAIHVQCFCLKPYSWSLRILNIVHLSSAKLTKVIAISYAKNTSEK